MARAAVLAMKCRDQHVPDAAASVRALLAGGWGVVLVAPGDAAGAAALAVGATRSGRRAVPIVTHTLVDPADPAFAHPDAAVDPEPLAVLEAEAIAALVRSGFPVVVAGHVPVVPTEGPDEYGPVAAVLDDAAAAQRLAADVGALALVFLADADGDADLAWLRDDGWAGRDIDVRQAERWLATDPSLAPEVRAAVRFLRAGGEIAVITTPPGAAAALEGPGDSDAGAPVLRIHRELAARPSDAPVLAAGWC